MFHERRICQGILALVLALEVVSCSPRHGLAENHSSDVKESGRKELSHTSDCITVAERVRIVRLNDTVRIDSIRYVLRWRLRTDTVLVHDSICKTDSVYIEKIVDPRNFIEKTADKAGNVCLLLLFLIIIVKLLKIKKNDKL